MLLNSTTCVIYVIILRNVIFFYVKFLNLKINLKFISLYKLYL